MNFLTHQQAQRYLHTQADHALSAQETIALQAHLATCSVCRTYATELTILEKRVRRILFAHWSLHSSPLTDPLIAVKNHTRKSPMYKSSLRFASTLLVAVLLFLTLTSILTFLLPNPTSLPATQPVTNSEIIIESLSSPATPTESPFEDDKKFPIIQQYTVKKGDTFWSIAEAFGLQPETILFTNEDQLADDVHNLFPGMELLIPPIDGLFYKWQAGDTLDEVATKFNAHVEDIIEYPGNALDSSNPTISPDTLILIPGGSRELRIWTIPDATRDYPEALRTYGPGACLKPSEGVIGTGTILWPTDAHYISGNDFWSGHPGIDIGVSLDEDVIASDDGVVIFSGWSNFGYGNLIMLDHGNGYLTIYAHLNKVVARCGESVSTGQVIGNAGVTGNTTGPNLHFEVRLNGEALNPWTVLPSP